MSYKSIKHNPYSIVKMFEEEVAEYTGAPYAVAVDSCSNAIFLACYYQKLRHEMMFEKAGVGLPTVSIPKKTYLSIPMSVHHSGHPIKFVDFDWSGQYRLNPLPIYDSAKKLTSNMYKPLQHMCLSFHIKKLLPIGKGGMILTDDPEAVRWYKKARYEGRSECNYRDDDVKMMGWNMYMDPQIAARGLSLMQNYPEHVEDLGEHEGYRDLTEMTIFKEYLNDS